ncbi:hypothetical protein [Nitritalea halalkaliphila]|uniref:hypothetical protein n=1 Tax=Nitritalea halalkaliphila TaxID=590849 RepID=UPI00030BA1F3
MKFSLKGINTLDLYGNRSRIKVLVIVSSFVIGISSLFYTHMLVEELREREKRQIELFANALEYAYIYSENLNFVTQEIIQQNYSIPVIVVDRSGTPTDFKNIKFKRNATDEEIDAKLADELKRMEAEYEPIYIEDAHVYYRNSELLYSLRYYPYVQLSVILVFGLLVYVVFNQTKLAEQNRVWAGLTKETAHQLGTPSPR